VTALDFLSPGRAPSEVRLVSPLARILQGSEAIVDVSHVGKLEARGPVANVTPGPGEDLIPITDERALLVTPNGTKEAAARLEAAGCRVYDLTAALAALEVNGEQLLRRLTQLDLEQLPAVGGILRETPAVIQRVADESFRLYVPQELAESVAEAIRDLLEGLR
jgi:hypothetical protein